MASQLLKERNAMTNRLDNIAVRQRTCRVRDLVFAALVLIAGAVSLSSLSTAAHAHHDASELAKR